MLQLLFHSMGGELAPRTCRQRQLWLQKQRRHQLDIPDLQRPRPDLIWRSRPPSHPLPRSHQKSQCGRGCWKLTSWMLYATSRWQMIRYWAFGPVYISTFQDMAVHFFIYLIFFNTKSNVERELNPKHLYFMSSATQLHQGSRFHLLQPMCNNECNSTPSSSFHLPVGKEANLQFRYTRIRLRYKMQVNQTNVRETQRERARPRLGYER